MECGQKKKESMREKVGENSNNSKKSEGRLFKGRHVGRVLAKPFPSLNLCSLERNSTKQSTGNFKNKGRKKETHHCISEKDEQIL